MKSNYDFTVYSLDREGSINRMYRWHEYKLNKSEEGITLRHHNEGYLNYGNFSLRQQELFKLVENRGYSHRMIAVVRKRPL